MFYFLMTFAFVSCAFAGTLTNHWEGRIVNGVDTTIQAHPYQVSLQTNTGSHFCGGSIISENIIVTAAHCLQTYQPYQFKVRLGSTEYDNGGELVAVKAFKYHEGYNSTVLMNDVAVIKLSSPVRESSKVRYIKLAQKTPATGTPAIVTGWGTKCYLYCGTLPKTLQEVEVDIVNEKTCASDEYKYGSRIRETMVCAYASEKDTCQSDSGGPMVSQNQLVGIVSWGIGCALSGYPGVYCEVAAVRAWIEKTAKEL